MADAPKPMSKTQYVLERLRAEIASGEVDPGTSLRQIELAQRYGVSPTPVREALRLLEADGSILYSPHRGATIRELDPEVASDLYLLRSTVEGLATALAAERATPEQIEALRVIHRDIVASQDGQELALLNRRFHLALFSAGSDFIANHAASLWSKFPPALTLWSDTDAVTALTADHDEIIDAVVARDIERARRLGAEHVLRAERLRDGHPA